MTQFSFVHNTPQYFTQFSRFCRGASESWKKLSAMQLAHFHFHIRIHFCGRLLFVGVSWNCIIPFVNCIICKLVNDAFHAEMNLFNQINLFLLLIPEALHIYPFSSLFPLLTINSATIKFLLALSFGSRNSCWCFFFLSNSFCLCPFVAIVNCLKALHFKCLHLMKQKENEIFLWITVSPDTQ